MKFEEQCTDEADDGLVVREDADDICAALDLAIESFDRAGRVKLGPMLGWKGHVGAHISFGVVHKCAALRPSDTELIGDMPPSLHGTVMIGLDKGLAGRGRDHGVLAFGNLSVRIAHRMNVNPWEGLSGITKKL